MAPCDDTVGRRMRQQRVRGCRGRLLDRGGRQIFDSSRPAGPIGGNGTFDPAVCIRQRSTVVENETCGSLRRTRRRTRYSTKNIAQISGMKSTLATNDHTATGASANSASDNTIIAAKKRVQATVTWRV